MNFAERTVNGVLFGYAEGFGPGVAHGFSTRKGGVSRGILDSLNLGAGRGDEPANVRENFTRFCTAIGADVDKLVFSAQVHEAEIRVCTAADGGVGLDRPVHYQADGLITDVPGLALAVFSADCLPILLYDPVRGVVAAVHAGWRGTALGIGAQAVEKMTKHYGCHPGDICAAIGPGISKCCFETHEDVPNAMTESMGAAALHYIQVRENGTFRVDLKGLNACRLERAGLSADHIAVSPDCTACMPERYWSHRVTRGERGSMAAVIQLETDWDAIVRRA